MLPENTKIILTAILFSSQHTIQHYVLKYLEIPKQNSKDTRISRKLLRKNLFTPFTLLNVFFLTLGILWLFSLCVLFNKANVLGDMTGTDKTF